MCQRSKVPLEKTRMSRHVGAFVYQGAGKNVGDDPQLKKCKNQTLDVQWCLAKNNHQQNRCEATIELWRQCYERAREAAETEPASA